MNLLPITPYFDSDNRPLLATTLIYESSFHKGVENTDLYLRSVEAINQENLIRNNTSSQLLFDTNKNKNYFQSNYEIDIDIDVNHEPSVEYVYEFKRRVKIQNVKSIQFSPNYSID